MDFEYVKKKEEKKGDFAMIAFNKGAYFLIVLFN